MGIYVVPVLLTMWALLSGFRGSIRADHLTVAGCAIVAAAICGFRWNSDADFGGYFQIYSDTAFLSGFTSASIASIYGEPGYLFLVSVFKSLGAGFGPFVLACSVCSIGLKSAVVTKLSRQASLALCLYLCLQFVTTEFIQMRWALATAFLSLAFCLQYLKRYRLAVLAYFVAAGFHYFASFFWILAILTTMKGHRRFYVIFGISILGSFFIRAEHLSGFLPTDSEIYALQRLTRYAADPASHIGVISLAKLLMYPLIYSACVHLRPNYPWKADRLNQFLFKLSLILLSGTVLMTVVPVFHARATVLVDFFAIIWILNAMHVALSVGTRTVAFTALAILYCAWYVIDVSNNRNAMQLSDYHTWLIASR